MYSNVAVGLASHHHHNVHVEMGSVDRFLDDILREKPARFTPENLREFIGGYAERLGADGFGVVYRGRFPNGVQVAVKTLHRTPDHRAEDQFMAEVATAGCTYHINLVRLYGFYFDATTKALVYDQYLENDSLDRVLFEPGNVLLTVDYAPKVADIGLAKLCRRDNTHLTMTGAQRTLGYMVLELWLPLPVMHKCNMYIFGMLVFEILGRQRNLETQRPRYKENKF